jgi:hypothetical protein
VRRSTLLAALATGATHIEQVIWTPLAELL